MKKLSILLLLLLFIPLEVNASSVIVMETNSNRILYSLNKDEQYLTASIAKILTAMVAIESGKLNKMVRVDASIFEAYGSGIYIEYGEEIILRDLVTGLLLRSGNDAALMIATFVSGSVENFVKEMNALAKEIGMKNSSFGNPHGLDEKTKNISTAYDMALLSSYAIGNEEYRNITKLKKKVVKTDKKTYEWENKNRLVRTYKYAIGGKTGFTERAGRTLVTNAKKNDLSLTVITFKASDDFKTHEDLYEKYFKKYQYYSILDKKHFDVVDKNFYDKELFIKTGFAYPLTKTEKENVKIRIELKEKPTDKTAGTVFVYLNKKVIHQEPIFYKEKKESFIEKVKKWFKND